MDSRTFTADWLHPPAIGLTGLPWPETLLTFDITLYAVSFFSASESCSCGQSSPADSGHPAKRDFLRDRML